MTSFYRDMAILAAAIVVGVLWSIYSLVTRRGHRIEVKEEREASARLSEKQAPVSGMPEYAAANGWTGPSAELDAGNPADEYVHRMFRNIWGFSSSTDVDAGGPRYANLYSGQSGGRAFTLGNVWMRVATKDCPGSVCVLHLGETLPPLFVNLRGHQPYMRFGMKEMAFESEDFNRRFQVLAVDRKYAMDVVSERTMQLLLTRDDWVFALEFDRLLCLTKRSLAGPDDYASLLASVTGIADLIPRFVQDDRALKLPTLPDGTTLDLEDPASRQKFGEAVMAMSPEERERFLAQARVQGARFLAGMFGKELPPKIEERLEEGTPEG